MNPFDGFFARKFDILKPRWLPTIAPDNEAHLRCAPLISKRHGDLPKENGHAGTA
jgi:hypothetical protein